MSYSASTNQGPNSDNNGNSLSASSGLSSYYAYTYDIENRIVITPSGGPGGTTFYSYAPGNKRVWRGNGGTVDELTFWSPSGQKLGTYALTTTAQTYLYGMYYGPYFYATQTGTNYYFGSKLIKNASGWVYSDRLGSIGKFYPYGQERPSPTANGTEKFTGYFRDAETGNDYAINRYATPGVGRFLTADPYRANNGGSGDPSDPGSWNRYAYVEDDPVNAVDPEGLMLYTGPGSGGDSDPVGPDPGGFGLVEDFGFSTEPSPRPSHTTTTFGGGVAQNSTVYSGLPTTFSQAQAAFRGDAKTLAATRRFKINCDKDFSAVGVSAAQVRAGAAAAVFVNGVGSSVAMASLYASSPVPGIQQSAGSIAGTVGGFIAANPGTVAVAQLGGSAIYLNSSLISPGAYYTDLAVLLHEILHNITGLTDSDIQSALGLPETNVSDNITQKLLKDCF